MVVTGDQLIVDWQYNKHLSQRKFCKNEAYDKRENTLVSYL